MFRAALLSLALCAPLLRAQVQTFEVVAIKPNNSGDRRTGFSPLSGDRFTASNVTVLQMIQFAYKLQDFQILGAPAWTKDKRFDLEAKAPPNTATDQLASMMQSLLSERFNLRTHTDEESLPVYSLIPADSGSKLRDAAPCATSNPCVGMTVYPEGHLIGRAVEMPPLAANLSFLLSRPVLDETHLTGKYDFDLRWRPDSLTATPDDHAQSDDPEIFTALQQQLGLKLKTGKAPVTILRVDAVDEPTAN